MLQINKIYCIDALEGMKQMESESVDCIITSPPYWNCRDYNVAGQLGREETYFEYVKKLLDIFTEAKRVLKKEGTCWINIGDVYGGTGDKGEYKDPKYPEGRNGQEVSLSKNIMEKCLLQIPSRFAIAMCDNNWLLRNRIIWHKPNCMPSPVKDRFIVDYEDIFFFVKNKKYYFKTMRIPHKMESLRRACRARTSSKLDVGQYAVSYKQDNVGYNNIYDKLENGELRGVHSEGRNMRCVWDISLHPFSGEHFATFPEELIDIPIEAGCPENGVVLDMFMGAGTTALVALKQRKKFIGFELNPEYIKIANERIKMALGQKSIFEYEDKENVSET